MNTRYAHTLLATVLCLCAFEAPVLGEAVLVLDWNILTYDNPGSAEYEALVRIVQALNPKVILFQEANNAAGRTAFMAAFSTQYPYSFLGAPASDNPRNQILSAYPITLSGQIFTADPWGGSFERPTIWADLDVLSARPGPELRVYSAHYKSGSDSRDSTLRLNQATDDANHIAAFVTSNPQGQVYYAGDLNCEVGSAPITTLLQAQTTLARQVMLDPNNGSAMTRWPSGKTIDHAFYSATLAGRLLNPFIFHTNTFPPGTVPPPALANDSHTASDHLALVVTIDIYSIPADLNQDGDVDDLDYEVFASCLAAPGVTVSGECSKADLDYDTDVDQADFGLLQKCFSGRNIPADPACAQ